MGGGGGSSTVAGCTADQLRTDVAVCMHVFTCVLYVRGVEFVHV